MTSPFSSVFGVHGEALALREQRMKLIASNLANADTPNYKARDLDFSRALEAATSGAAPEGGLQKTSVLHLDASGQLAGSAVFERNPLQPSLDGNTVDTSSEQAAYGRAALEYRASLSFFEGKVRGLLTAITGQ
ncbi:flagellar basal body rod protein FlgB [Coralloluteibacterium stylophorae]|uniref:Flagellar basal body rod protein FlgB n=1 Tax=Coralloluteibacterium stylophorae TaxID=1776034 RepID=A0A8J7VVA7_9GAMM|nr:flagellar basal body rod protein FlgB [Coralloluteibacterium stylophorae]MBS7457194.1 flagellar basal body rod protein FlgB [Coralloluteibacterium stylophorae]